MTMSSRLSDFHDGTKSNVHALPDVSVGVAVARRSRRCPRHLLTSALNDRPALGPFEGIGREEVRTVAKLVCITDLCDRAATLQPVQQPYALCNGVFGRAAADRDGALTVCVRAIGFASVQRRFARVQQRLVSVH